MNTDDTGATKRYQPVDATTTPSLILEAATLPKYSELMAETLVYGRRQSDDKEEQANHACDYLTVGIGREIQGIVPGYIATLLSNPRKTPYFEYGDVSETCEARPLCWYFYKTRGYPTVVVGASFRNVDEMLQLSGCGCLTISPALLNELKNSSEPMEQKIVSDRPLTCPEKVVLDEAAFCWVMNEDPEAVAIKHNTRNKTIYTGRVAGNCAQQAKNSCS